MSALVADAPDFPSLDKRGGAKRVTSGASTPIGSESVLAQNSSPVRT